MQEHAIGALSCLAHGLSAVWDVSRSWRALVSSAPRGASGRDLLGDRLDEVDVPHDGSPSDVDARKVHPDVAGLDSLANGSPQSRPSQSTACGRLRRL